MRFAPRRDSISPRGAPSAESSSRSRARRLMIDYCRVPTIPEREFTLGFSLPAVS